MSPEHRAPVLAPAARRIAAGVALLSVLTLAACTTSGQGGDFTGEQAAVEDVLTSLGDRANRDDAAGICERILTRELAAEFGRTAGGDCKAAIQRATDHADYTGLVAERIELDDDAEPTAAVATIDTVEDAGFRTVELVKDGNQWRVSDLAPKAPAKTATDPGDAASTSPAE